MESVLQRMKTFCIFPEWSWKRHLRNRIGDKCFEPFGEMNLGGGPFGAAGDSPAFV